MNSYLVCVEFSDYIEVNAESKEEAEEKAIDIAIAENYKSDWTADASHVTKVVDDDIPY